MKTKHSLTVAVTFCMLILVSSCYKNMGNYSSSTNSTIAITGSAFSPSSLTVTMGSTVTWKNNDSAPHTVMTDDGSINSGDIAAGASYSKAFSIAGTYKYHDTHDTNMMGVVIVTTAVSGY